MNNYERILVDPSDPNGPLPHGWDMMIDRSSTGSYPFFVDHNTGTTHWQDPRAVTQPNASHPYPYSGSYYSQAQPYYPASSGYPQNNPQTVQIPVHHHNQSSGSQCYAQPNANNPETFYSNQQPCPDNQHRNAYSSWENARFPPGPPMQNRDAELNRNVYNRSIPIQHMGSTNRGRFQNSNHPANPYPKGSNQPPPTSYPSQWQPAAEVPNAARGTFYPSSRMPHQPPTGPQQTSEASYIGSSDPMAFSPPQTTTNVSGDGQKSPIRSSPYSSNQGTSHSTSHPPPVIEVQSDIPDGDDPNDGSVDDAVTRSHSSTLRDSVSKDNPSKESGSLGGLPADSLSPSSRCASPAPLPEDSAERIKVLTERVEELQQSVTDYMASENGGKDKQYRFLDEMLTRVMLDLDNTDSQGLAEIRNARKKAIIKAQEASSLLEGKLKSLKKFES